MAFLLFVDESGQDRKESPYEVLAGIAVQDSSIWKLINKIHQAEIECFGQIVSRGGLELKGKKILKAKVFRQAQEMADLPLAERLPLVQFCLERGAEASLRHRTALAQAKLDFVGRVLDQCGKFKVKAFASIVPQEAPRPAQSFLRKDYSYLFERYYDFMKNTDTLHRGLVVFDELEKSQSHILIGQMEHYFLETAKGRQRSERILPEPLFVHSDLTCLIQVADLAAYLISWGLRLNHMTEPCRDELRPLVEKLFKLNHRGRPRDQGEPPTWGFKLITDLRPRSERLPPGSKMEKGNALSGKASEKEDATQCS